MDTVFDTEQWAWRRAYEKYDLCGISNAVNCGEEGQVLVAIPVEFIFYLKNMHNFSSDIELSRVSLYLDRMSSNFWVFGYDTNIDGVQYAHDLWSYSRILPSWVDPRVTSAKEKS